MRMAPSFLLTREQAGRLHGYIQTYRRYAFTSLHPSSERNMALRVLQAVQGKLIEAMDQVTTQLALALTKEEIEVLKATVTILVSLYSQQPASAERIATLGDLASLKVCLAKY